MKFFANYLLIPLILFFGTTKKTMATHALGGDLTYDCIAGNQYLLTYSFYRDCAGNSEPASVKVRVQSVLCNQNYEVTLNKIAGTGQELDPLTCNSVLSQCEGGAYPGVEIWEYQATTTLPSNCSDWVISKGICCRNVAITTVANPNDYDMYLEAHLNNLTVACNSSPVFSNPPAAFTCVNEAFCYNNGALDPDGDSLVYALINPMDNATTPVPYSAPYTPFQPLTSSPALSFDPADGDICFTPTVLGEVTPMAMLVQEYRNGLLIGSVVRDIQIRVVNCNNKLPISTGINGTGSFDLDTLICAGSPVSFFINTYDSSLTDTVFLSWNQGIPGATFTITPGQFPSGNFNWIPNTSDIGPVAHCFTINMQDNHCPFVGIQAYSVCITVGGVIAGIVPSDSSISCYDSAAISAFALQGAGAISYLWSTGETAQTAILPPGVFYVTITDSIGCFDMDTVTLTAYDEPVALFSATATVCLSENIAFINNSTLDSGTIASYSWNFGDGDSSFLANPSHLYAAAGNYLVSLAAVSDTGCADTFSAPVRIIGPPFADAGSDTVLCFGNPIQLNGGAMTGDSILKPCFATEFDLTDYPIPDNSHNNNQYSTTAGVSIPLTFSGLCSPTVTPGMIESICLNITHSTGQEIDFFIACPDGTWIQLSTDNTAAASGYSNVCFTPDATRPIATANPPFTGDYIPEGNLSNLVGCPTNGAWILNVQDDGNGNNGNILDWKLTFDLSACDSNCYYVDWTPGTTLSDSTILNPVASPTTNIEYTLSITDKFGCFAADSVTVSINPPLAPTLTGTSPACNGSCNGSASLTVSGGTPPYSAAWSNGDTGLTTDSLCAGTYSATVTDGVGCDSVVPVTLTQPAVFGAWIDRNDPVRCDECKSHVHIKFSGGTTPFSYVAVPPPSVGNYFWSNPNVEWKADGFCSGYGFSVTFTDANGCDTAFTITVPQNQPITASISSINPVSCYGGSNGSATASVSGGTTPYTYSWNTTPVQTTSTATGLAAGTYTVYITDDKSCSATLDTVMVTQPPQITSVISNTVNVNCNGGSSGSATSTASGGTPLYIYLWCNGQTTSTATGLSAGNCPVTVTDSNGCTSSVTATINQPAALSLSITSVTNISCSGGSDGAASVTASGGTPSYTYLWCNTQTLSSATGLGAGTCTVTVTDFKGCSSTVTATVTQPGTLVAAIPTKKNITCPSGTDGQAVAVGVSGTSPYTYLWNTTPPQNTATATGLTGSTGGTTYFVTVTDNKGCTSSAAVIITEPPAFTVTITTTPVNCGQNDGQSCVTVTGGTPYTIGSPYNYTWNSNPIQNSQCATNLPVGNISVIASDSLQCTVIGNATITGVDIVLTLISSSNVSCYGGTNGQISVSASGSTPPYSFVWSNTETTSAVTELTAGTYSVTATDSNGCAQTMTIPVTQPQEIISSVFISNVSCSGGSNGSASVVESNQFPPYTYSWSAGGQSAQTATGLPAGTYSITVTDSTGCTMTGTAAVSQPAQLVLNISGKQNVQCFGESNGSATLTINGGSPPYSYLWSNGNTESAISNLQSAIYTVTVTDLNSCSEILTTTITQPALLGFVFSYQDIKCFGACNGSASIAVNGGTAPYSYLWTTTPAQTASNAIGLCPGIYSLFITDANGCDTTVDFSLSEPPPLTSTAGVINQVSCNGAGDGSAYISATGGTFPYTFLWAPGGQTNDTATGLAASSYSVSVTDFNGCIVTKTVVINEPAVLSVAIAKTDLLCYIDGENGSVTVSATGGTLPYSYSWSHDTTFSGSEIEEIPAGLYSATVTDLKGCSGSVSITVTRPPLLGVTLSSVIHVTCFGMNDGRITAVASGGTPPYTYQWNDPDTQTAALATGLVAGNYSLIVIDANGCDSIVPVTITEPPAFTAAITNIINVSCQGLKNGSATLNASGGSPPYTYSWNTVPSQSGSVATGLDGGTYAGTVFDANNCSSSDTVVIFEPPPLMTAIDSVIHISCNGTAAGAVALSPSGGTAAYSVVWSPPPASGQTTLTATGLDAGTYSATVTDYNGCTVSVTATVNQPVAGLSVTGSVVANVTCYGGSTGSAAVSATGGTPPYTYLWSPGGKTTSIIKLIQAGTWCVTVSDAFQCTETACVIVTEPFPLSASTDSLQNVACSGGLDGMAIISATGGFPPYSFQHLWNGSWAYGSSDTLDNLSASSYSVKTVDSAGCNLIYDIVVVEPLPLTLSFSIQDANCDQSDGIASVMPSGGTPPHAYLWMPTGQTNDTATGLPSGTYMLTVTDFNGCTLTDTIAVNEPPSPSASITKTDLICFSDSSGSAAVTATGGTAPYTYLWSNGAASASLSGLSSGIYFVTVYDINGCNQSVSVTITQPPLLGITILSVIHVSCFGMNDGRITTVASGGTTPYTYRWNDPDSQTTSLATGLIAGNYSLTVTDLNGCDTVVPVTITQPPVLTAAITDSVNVACKGQGDGTATVTATGGTPPYTYSWNTIPSQPNSVATGLDPGTYVAMVFDDNNCSSSDSVTISEPSLLMVTVDSLTHVYCKGDSTGNITLSPTGGMAPYSITWSPNADGQTTVIATGLAAGSYSATVTDNNGCFVSTAAAVNEPAALLSVNGMMTEYVKCFGDSNGAANVSPSGGTPPYTYGWTPGGKTTATIKLLAAGTWCVTVSDAGQCTATMCVIVTEPPPLSVNTDSLRNVACAGGTDGMALISAAGGISPYTFQHQWNGIFIYGLTDTLTGLSAVSYSVTATDSNGCNTLYSIVIAEPLPVTLSFAIQNANCGNNDGSAGVTPSGGTPPYSYNWGTGSTTDTIFAVFSGVYPVTVTDSNGCVLSGNALINDIVVFFIQDSTSSTLCYGGTDGTVQIIVQSGSPPYDYYWSTGDTSVNNPDSIFTIDSLPEGLYTVTVIDTNNCKLSKAIIVSGPNPLVQSQQMTEVNCFGQADGKITVVMSGEFPPYTFVWSNGASGSTAIGLLAGNYSVTITDSLGCDTLLSFEIMQPPPLSADISDSANSSCFGFDDGYATVAVSGGHPPYTYTWTLAPDPDQTSETATGLSPGTYPVLVSDTGGCPVSENVTLTQPDTLVPAISSVVNVGCNGNCDGALTANVIGGTNPYTYYWIIVPSQTTQTASGLCPGTYQVVVADSNNCYGEATEVITQPDLLFADIISVTDDSCFGDSNGTAAVAGTGGSSPYSYLWSNGQTLSAINNLQSAIYIVTLTDANSCSSSDSVMVNQPAPAVVTIVDSTPVSCYGGNDGSAQLSATGGTPPYTYLWEPSTGGQPTAIAYNLPAGTYSATITDSRGCISIGNVTITQPPQLLATFSQIAGVSCNGLTDGSITVTPAGGTPPYSLYWVSPYDTVTGNTIAGLQIGTYSITVTDSMYCTSYGAAAITQPDPLVAVADSQINASCYGIADGAAFISATGGTSPYSYLWNDPDTQTTSPVTGLSAGTYWLTVTDTLGCDITLSVTITQPDSLQASLMLVNNVNCSGNPDGVATVILYDQYPPYSFAWSNGDSLQTATGLDSGNYTVTVTDGLGCEKILSFRINRLTQLSAAIFDSANISCYGLDDGFATVSVAGGREPYTYAWTISSDPVQTNETATGLSSGIYVVMVTDSGGCSVFEDVVLTQPDSLIASIGSVLNISCNGNCDGALTANIIGGTNPYTYYWIIIPSQTTQTASGLCPGTYQVVVADTNNCYSEAEGVITQPDILFADIVSVTHDTCFGDSNGTAAVAGTGGSSPYSYLWNNGQALSAVSNLPSAIYIVTLTDANGCSSSDSVTVNQPTQVVAAIVDSTPVSCFGGNDGSAIATATGGSPPYSFLWSDTSQQSTVVAYNLPAGTYSVTITDSRGCISTGNVIITEPPQLSVAFSQISNVSCNGLANGLMTVAPTGGTPPYTYNWIFPLDSVVGNTVSGLQKGVYSVTVTDTMYCTSYGAAAITQPVPLVAMTDSQKNASCYGMKDGVAVISVTGGTAPYSYLWNDPDTQTTGLATGLSAGAYLLSVTDSLGCDTTLTVTITQPDTLIASAQLINHVICNGDSSGKAFVDVAGGTKPYTYSWLPSGGGNDTATGLDTGMYLISINDSLGCQSADSIAITQPPPIEVFPSEDTIFICVGMSATFSATASGGTGSLAWLWLDSGGDTVGTSPGPYTITPADSITYFAIVTDSLSCSERDTVIINVHPLIIVFAAPDSVCEGDSTIIGASATGGDGNYSFVWSTNEVSDSILVTPLQTTTYSLFVTDGCGSPAAIDSVTVEVNPYPSVSVFPASGSGCLFAFIIFKDTLTQIPGTNYIWYFGDGDTSLFPSPLHIYDSVGIFSVSVGIISPKGCRTDSLGVSAIVISPPPDGGFVTEASDIAPSFFTVNFTDITIGSPVVNDTMLTWDWDFGDYTGSTEQNPAHSYPADSIYNVEFIVTNQYGCKDTVEKVIVTCSLDSFSTDTLVIAPYPDAKFSTYPYSPTDILFNEIKFFDESKGGNLKDTLSGWFWDFGDSNTTNIQNPTHFYEIGGYNVVLVVTNRYGCRDTAKNDMIIKPVFQLWIPKAFTPNGDGNNDYFIPEGIGIKDFQMYIFSRWGQKLYYTNDIRRPWEGTVDGGTEVVQMDVYVYDMIITDVLGATHEFIGRVTMVK